MFWLMVLIVGLISSLVFHPLFNTKAGEGYWDKLNKIWGTYWSTNRSPSRRMVRRSISRQMGMDAL
ncbi:hypothetical protein [Caldanaerobacter subterraneus]|uniref:hypothetical protein n=1 Tax=Caldanaerobacter subterraneus TaxID=911092 RepID=UPI001F1FD8C8|nr:hypothetical protein [Caldanaerobacter subterraneus]